MQKNKIWAKTAFAFSVVVLLAVSACAELLPEEPAPTTTRTFEITMATIAYGFVNVSPNGPYTQGTLITLEPIPALNYLFSAWQLTPALSPQPADNGKWTFSMPNTNVTVNAEFLHRNNYPFAINKGTHDNGDFTITPDTPQKSGTTIILRPVPTNDNYKFDHWDTTPSSLAITESTTLGEWRFTMLSQEVTINAVFVEDTVPMITTGVIVVSSPPAVDETAATVTSPATVDSGNFSAVLSNISGGRLVSGKYIRKQAYRFEYTLTAETDYRFVSTTQITVQNSSGTVYDNVVYTFTPGIGDTAKVTVTFPRTIDWPANPAAVDLALGRGSTAVASDQSQYNSGAVPANPFDGTSYLLTDTGTTVWQADGGTTAHWLAVDLGEVKQLGTVVITWGPGNNRLWDGMVAGVVQVADLIPDPEDDPDYDPDFPLLFMTPGNYSNYGWTTVGIWENPSRDAAAAAGKIPPASATTTSETRPTDAAYLPWINVIHLDPDTQGRYIRVKATEPLTNGYGSNTGTWTTWPRISMMEVYSETVTE